MLCFLVEALSIKAAPGFFSFASSASSYRRRFSPMPLLGVKKLVKQWKLKLKLVYVDIPFCIFYVNVEFINQVL